MDFEEAQKAAIAFRNERDWTQYNNPKDVAISISLEAAELLECFQWSGTDLTVAEHHEEMADELADVMIYCIDFAERTGIDIPSAIVAKLEKNAQKYPVERAKGKKSKYTEL